MVHAASAAFVLELPDATEAACTPAPKLSGYFLRTPISLGPVANENDGAGNVVRLDGGVVPCWIIRSFEGRNGLRFEQLPYREAGFGLVSEPRSDGPVLHVHTVAAAPARRKTRGLVEVRFPEHETLVFVPHFIE